MEVLAITGFAVAAARNIKVKIIHLLSMARAPYCLFQCEAWNVAQSGALLFDMMSVHECQDRAEIALKSAREASLPEIHEAWKAIAREWEMIATIAGLQHSLISSSQRKVLN